MARSEYTIDKTNRSASCTADRVTLGMVEAILNEVRDLGIYSVTIYAPAADVTRANHEDAEELDNLAAYYGVSFSLMPI